MHYMHKKSQYDYTDSLYLCINTLLKNVHVYLLGECSPSTFKISYNESKCHICLQHNGYISKICFSTFPSAAYTNDTTSNNLYALCNFKFLGFN